MGGELGVESVSGAGSTFTLRLPLPVAENPLGEEPLSEGPSPSPTGGRLLLTEDDPAIRKLLLLMLAPTGWQVEVACDGEEAVEKWQRESFDMVLMDLQMPRLDGLEATRRIRELEQGRTGPGRTCIIALTAHASEAARQQCAAAGMDDFISKPVHAAEVNAVLAACMARQRD